MNGFDLVSCVASAVLLPPSVVTATGTGTLTPDTINMVGRASFFAVVGPVVAGSTMAITLEQGDTITGPWTAVPGAVINLSAASANTVVRVGVQAVDTKRFVRANYTVSGAGASLNVAVLISSFTAVR
jgi:hypothetical protein